MSDEHGQSSMDLAMGKGHASNLWSMLNIMTNSIVPRHAADIATNLEDSYNTLDHFTQGAEESEASQDCANLSRLDTLDKNGMTLLHRACSKGQLDTVMLL